jgi:hypothetical protein
MGFVDILKKLNILRAGSVSGTYTNAKDRPMALQDDMFLGKPEPNKEENKSSQSGDKNKPKTPGRIALIVSIVLAIFFILLSLTTTIAWLIIIAWVVWVTYIWLVYTKRFKPFGFSLTITLIVFCVVSFLVVLLTQSDPSGSSNGSIKNAAKTLSAQQCEPYYEKYNGKILKISSDGLEGTVGIKIDKTNGCKLLGYYSVLLARNIPENPYKRDVGPSYHYIVLLRTKGQTTRTSYDSFGALSPAFKNVTTLPDPFADSVARSELYSQGVQAAETRYFYWGYKLDAPFSEERYQEILDSTQLDIVDGMPYIEEKQESDGGYSYSINHDNAAVKGTIVKSYALTIE